jgi:branched-subunit amino acid ABC-type transport system permease component
MRPRRPFQFSLATLMLVVTAYAVLFGLLRWLRLPNGVFVMASLYVTTIVYCQWALFDGRRPGMACVLTSGGLFALAFLALWAMGLFWHMVSWSHVVGEMAPDLVVVSAAGATFGIGLAGITDLVLLAHERVRGIRPNPLEPERPPSRSAPDAPSPDEGRSTRGVRRAVLALLAGLFFATVLWAVAVKDIPLP